MYSAGLTEEIKGLLDRYRSYFKEPLPLFEFSGNQEKLIQVLKTCLERGEKYKPPETPKDCLI